MPKFTVNREGFETRWRENRALVNAQTADLTASILTARKRLDKAEQALLERRVSTARIVIAYAADELNQALANK